MPSYRSRTLLVLEGLCGPEVYGRIVEVEENPASLPQAQHIPQQHLPQAHLTGETPAATMDTSHIPDSVKHVSASINDAGGSARLVGGSVRDHPELMGKPSKDYDIEVYGMHPDHLQDHLSTLGKVDAVGKAFGVLKLVHGKEDFDVSVPRRESKVGAGHKGFIPKPDPTMTPAEAAKRRDFTMNAISMDPLTGHVYDPHGGIQDIRNRVLRATDKSAFAEDPLRILRGAQFAARFGMSVDPDTMKLMRHASKELPDLPRERVGGEWQKLLMKGETPSHGLQVMKDSGALEALHPELHALEGVPHDHPEIDAWDHTKGAVDRAAARTKRLPKSSKEAIRYAALLHNMARPLTTTQGEDGQPQSQGHGAAGGQMVGKHFRNQFVAEKGLIEKVQQLVAHHSHPHELFAGQDQSSDSKIRRLAQSLAPASIEELSHLTHSGHTGEEQESPAGQWLLQRAQELGVHQRPEKPILTGKHLMQLGVKPGPQMGQLIRQVFELQLDGKVTDEESAVQAAKGLIGQ